MTIKQKKKKIKKKEGCNTGQAGISRPDSKQKPWLFIIIHSRAIGGEKMK
jgi:hypothetical protein